MIIAVSVLQAAEIKGDLENKWFYLVKTVSTDPARDDDFNAWYDDIDIPDVLAVPDFKRARRAEGQDLETPYISENHEGKGKYVALYDIESTDIDKSIIDLYVAARKMVALGRITGLLKVTEANYYSLHTTYKAVPEIERSKYKQIYVQKILCCQDQNSNQDLIAWINMVLLPRIETIGLSKASLYDLYRIMEEVALTPEEIPHMLLIYEMNTDTSDEVVTGIQKVLTDLQNTNNWNSLFVEGDDSSVFLQRSDIYSK